MLIDWFTVGAQGLNFVILVWLLKRFLYRPVLDAIDAREARIARQIAEAATSQASALQEQADFKRRNEDFEARRDALLKQATADAEAERQRLMDSTRQAADASAAKRKEAERNDSERQRRGLAERTRAEVFAITRRLLADLADSPLEERVTAVFLRRLAALDIGVLTTLASGLDAATPRATVRSVFEPGAAQRDILRDAIAAALARGREDPLRSPLAIVFETTPDLLAGIEVVVAGRKLDWNVAEYMDALEQALELPAADVNRNAGAALADAAVPLPEPAA
jgi:F-type H+-transporting ATPase subunit b